MKLLATTIIYIMSWIHFCCTWKERCYHGLLLTLHRKILKSAIIINACLSSWKCCRVSWKQGNEEAHNAVAYQTKQHRRFPSFATANYQARDISPHVIRMFFELPPFGTIELQDAVLLLLWDGSFSSAWRQAEGTVSLTKPDKLAPRLPLRDEGWSRRE